MHRLVNRNVKPNDASGDLVETGEDRGRIDDALRRWRNDDLVGWLRRGVGRLGRVARRTGTWRQSGCRLALVRRPPLAAPDLAEVVARRLRPAAVAAASVRCRSRGGSMAAGSLGPAAAAMADCCGQTDNTEAVAAGMMGRRRAGVAVGCRRSIRKSRRVDLTVQIGPEQAPWRTVPPVARRPPTKHEMLCYAPSSSGLVWPATVRLRPVVMPGYYAHPCIIICESRLRNARLDIRWQRRTNF